MKSNKHQNIFPDVVIGEGYQIAESVVIGYPPLRKDVNKKTNIGKNLSALSNAVVYKGVELGDNAILGHNVVIREENIVGDNFKVWNNSIVDYGCVIGNNVKIHSCCYVAQYTVIEDSVFLAPGVIIGNDLHPGCDFSKTCMKDTAVTIRMGAQIGINSTILPGVTIGERALIGAGSVVTRDVPPETVVAGNPAKVTKSIYDLKCGTGLTDKPYYRDRR